MDLGSNKLPLSECFRSPRVLPVARKCTPSGINYGRRKAESFANFSNVRKLTQNLTSLSVWAKKKAKSFWLLGKVWWKRWREQRGVRLTSSGKCSIACVWVCMCLGRYKFLMILRQGKDGGGGHKRTGVRTLPAGKVLSHRTHSPTCVVVRVLSCSLECFFYSACSRGVRRLLLFCGWKKKFFLGIVSKAFQFLTFSQCF